MTNTRNFVFLTLLVFPLLSYSQSKSKVVKLYANTAAGQFRPNIRLSPNENFDFVGLSASLDFGQNFEKEQSHEIEFFFDWHSLQGSARNIKERAFHIRYEWKKYVFQSMQQRLRFSVGGSFRLYAYFKDNEATAPNTFDREQIIIGQEIAGVVRAEYEILPKLLLDVNLSFLNIGGSVDTEVNHNPILTERQRVFQTFELQLVDQLIGRIGLGYVF